MPCSVVECSEFGTLPWFLRLFLSPLVIFAVPMPTDGEVLYDSGGKPFQFDGRKGHQWIASVLAYLDWRAGDSWRPVSHRFHPEREHYIRGHRAVSQAWLRPEPSNGAKVVSFPSRRSAQAARRRAA